MYGTGPGIEKLTNKTERKDPKQTHTTYGNFTYDRGANTDLKGWGGRRERIENGARAVIQWNYISTSHNIN